jgi:hypothetical protein
MTSWASFVGQVERLRRLLVRVFARPARRRAPAAGEPLVAAEEPPAGGPPAHWVERVRRGAPGLLEPSLRSRGVPVQPVAEDFVPPEAQDETELEPPPHALEEAGHDDAPAEPAAVVPRPPAPRARAASSRKSSPSRKASPWRKVVRRMRIPSAGRTAAVDESAAPASDDMPVEVPAARNVVPLPEALPVAEVPDRPRAPDENPPTPVRVARPAADETEPPPQQQRTTVVEFEAPLVPNRTVRAERTVRDDAVTAPAPAPAPVAAEPAPVARLSDDAVVRRPQEPAVAAPAPRRGTDVRRAP